MFSPSQNYSAAMPSMYHPSAMKSYNNYYGNNSPNSSAVTAKKVATAFLVLILVGLLVTMIVFSIMRLVEKRCYIIEINDDDNTKILFYPLLRTAEARSVNNFMIGKNTNDKWDPDNPWTKSTTRIFLLTKVYDRDNNTKRWVLYVKYGTFPPEEIPVPGQFPNNTINHICALQNVTRDSEILPTDMKNPCSWKKSYRVRCPFF